MVRMQQFNKRDVWDGLFVLLEPLLEISAG
jgi:hypothetical protein